MSSPPTSENMAPPTPTPGRPRRNSDDSEQSRESWRNLIQVPVSYAGSTPMEQFLIEDHQRLECLAIPSAPSQRRIFSPPSSSDPSDLSIAEADCGSSTTYRSDSMCRCGGSICTTSSMPALGGSSLTSLSSATPSTCYHPQMYGLQEDSSGALYTYQLVSPALRTATRPDGTHPCLFFFNGCAEAFDREEDWVSHVDSHFANREIPPPSSCTCPLCGISFSAYDPPVNWKRFLKHTFGEHYVRDRFSQEISPHPDFVRYCRDEHMISDFTCTRFEGSQQANSGDDQIPRSLRRPRGGTDVARVLYPETWDSPEAQPRTATTIVVNHSRQPRGGRS